MDALTPTYYRWCVEEADTGLPVARGSAPTEARATGEMLHYAQQYAQDGMVRFWVRHKRKTVAQGEMGSASFAFSSIRVEPPK